MELNKKQKIILVLIFAIILIFLALNFFVPPQEINQNFEFSDFNLTKKIVFSGDNQTETYELDIKNPIVGFLIIPKTLATDVSKIKISGDFKTQIIQADPIIFFEPNNYTPGNKKIIIETKKSEQNHSTIFLPLNLTDYSNFTESEKTEIIEKVKLFNEIDENFFSIEETKKIIEEFSEGTKEDAEFKKKTNSSRKLFFSESNSNKSQKIISSLQNLINIRRNVNINDFKNNQITNSENNLNTNPKLDSSKVTATLDNIFNTRITTTQNSEDLTTVIIKFKPEKINFLLPSEIALPYSKNNGFVIWNGVVQFEEKTEVSEDILPRITSSENISVDFIRLGKKNINDYNLSETDADSKALLDELNKDNAKKPIYLMSIIIDTDSYFDQITTEKMTLTFPTFMGENYETNLLLVQNLCSENTNFFGSQDKDKVLLESIICLGKTGKESILKKLEKLDVNFVNTESISDELIISSIERDPESVKKLSEEINKKNEEFKQNYLKSNEQLKNEISELKNITQTAKNNIEELKQNLTTNDSIKIANGYISDYNELEIRFNLAIDPTSIEQREILNKQQLNTLIKDLTESNPEIELSETQLNTIENQIIQNNTLKYGPNWKRIVFTELNVIQSNLKEEFNDLEKAFAKHLLNYKLFSPTVGVSEACVELFKPDKVFDPNYVNYNSELNKDFREIVRYLEFSEAQNLGSDITPVLGGTRKLSEIEKKLAYLKSVHNCDLDLAGFENPSKSWYEIADDKVIEEFNYNRESLRSQIQLKLKEIVGIKLIGETLYDYNNLMNQNSKLKNEFDFNDILSPEYSTSEVINQRYLGLRIEKTNQTLLEVFESTLTREKFSNWLESESKNINYDTETDLFECIDALFSNSLKPTINTLIHTKFRGFVSDYYTGEQLESELLYLDNLIQQQYFLITEKLKLEKDNQNIQFILYNLSTGNAFQTYNKETNALFNTINGLKKIKEGILEGKSFKEIYENETNESSNTIVAFSNPVMEAKLKQEQIIYKNKTENKAKIESATTNEELEELIFPKEDQAKLTLQVANYYYENDLSDPAYQNYSYIKENLPNTPEAKIAERKMGELGSNWRLIYGRPFRKNFGQIAKEFTSINSIAMYIAISGFARLVIAPELATYKQIASAKSLLYQSKTTQIITASDRLLTSTSAMSTKAKFINTINSQITKLSGTRLGQLTSTGYSKTKQFFGWIKNSEFWKNMKKIVTKEWFIDETWYNNYIENYVSKNVALELGLPSPESITQKIISASNSAYLFQGKDITILTNEMERAKLAASKLGVITSKQINLIDEEIAFLKSADNLKIIDAVETSISPVSSLQASFANQQLISLSSVQQAKLALASPESISFSVNEVVQLSKNSTVLAAGTKATQTEINMALINEKISQLEALVVKDSTSATGILAANELEELKVIRTIINAEENTITSKEVLMRMATIQGEDSFIGNLLDDPSLPKEIRDPRFIPGTFPAGDGTRISFQMDSQGNITLFRNAKDEYLLTKSDLIATKDDLFKASEFNGSVSTALPTSANPNFSYMDSDGLYRVEFKIPQKDLMEAVQRGEAIIGNIGEAEIVLAPQFANKYVYRTATRINGEWMYETGKETQLSQKITLNQGQTLLESQLVGGGTIQANLTKPIFQTSEEGVLAKTTNSGVEVDFGRVEKVTFKSIIPKISTVNQPVEFIYPKEQLWEGESGFLPLVEYETPLKENQDLLVGINGQKYLHLTPGKKLTVERFITIKKSEFEDLYKYQLSTGRIMSARQYAEVSGKSIEEIVKPGVTVHEGTDTFLERFEDALWDTLGGWGVSTTFTDWVPKTTPQDGDLIRVVFTFEVPTERIFSKKVRASDFDSTDTQLAQFGFYAGNEDEIMFPIEVPEEYYKGARFFYDGKEGSVDDLLNQLNINPQQSKSTTEIINFSCNSPCILPNMYSHQVVKKGTGLIQISYDTTKGIVKMNPVKTIVLPTNLEEVRNMINPNGLHKKVGEEIVPYNSSDIEDLIRTAQSLKNDEKLVVSYYINGEISPVVYKLPEMVSGKETGLTKYTTYQEILSSIQTEDYMPSLSMYAWGYGYNGTRDGIGKSYDLFRRRAGIDWVEDSSSYLGSVDSKLNKLIYAGTNPSQVISKFGENSGKIMWGYYFKTVSDYSGRPSRVTVIFKLTNEQSLALEKLIQTNPEKIHDFMYRLVGKFPEKFAPNVRKDVFNIDYGLTVLKPETELAYFESASWIRKSNGILEVNLTETPQIHKYKPTTKTFNPNETEFVDIERINEINKNYGKTNGEE